MTSCCTGRVIRTKKVRYNINTNMITTRDLANEYLKALTVLKIYNLIDMEDK